MPETSQVLKILTKVFSKPERHQAWSRPWPRFARPGLAEDFKADVESHPALLSSANFLTFPR